MPTVWLHQSNKKKCLFNFIWKDVTKTISLDNDGGSYSQVTQNHLAWKCFPWYFYSITASCSSCSFSRLRLSVILYCSGVVCSFLCARCRLDTQSGLNLSQRFAAFPDWKWIPRSLSRIFSVRSSQIMAANYLVLRSVDKISVSSPWLVITLGTREKLRSGRLFLSFPQPTTRQNEGLAYRR